MISVELLDARREQRFVGDGATAERRGERDEGERHLTVRGRTRRFANLR
jgi:hypothetical protein